jgi:hypothetical protein
VCSRSAMAAKSGMGYRQGTWRSKVCLLVFVGPF